MNWTQVDIYTTTDGIDLLCSDLMDLGIRGFSIQDAEDFNEFLQNKDGKWDYNDEDLMGLSHCESCVTIYLPEDAQGAETLQMVQELLKRKKAADTEGKFGRMEAVLTGVKEEDWANNWKQYFKPFPVGEKLYIRPSWEHDEPEAGSKMLDMGCGSGILFIGGMLLGAKEVFAVDIEENAVRIAKKNAAENHLPEGSYTVRCGNVLSDEALRAEIGSGYDLITANIVADVLKAMAPLFPQFLKKTGTLIISGIIVERKDEVIAAMEAQGFVVTDCREKEGWAAVKLKQAE